MRILQKFLPLALVIALAAAGGYLRAQPADDEGDDGAVSVPMEKQAQLSPTEMRAKVEELIPAMRKMMAHVVELQQVARKKKDVIKLNCVNDKLLQIKQLLNITDSANGDMIEAGAEGDDSARYAHFSRIVISHEKVTGLRDEAEQCVGGDELFFLGDTEVSVDQPDFPDDPTADDPFYPDGDLVEPPGYASPFA